MQHFEGSAIEPQTPGLPEALGDAALQSQTLESLASAVNYHAWLTSLARPYLGAGPVEIGSGLGDYAQAWLDAGVPHVTVSDVEPSRLALLRGRFADERRVRVQALDVFNAAPAQHSALVAYNVLEHIPDDVGALRAAHGLVVSGGYVCVFVPAFSFAMSRFDRQVGHVRRYTVGSLTSALERAGLGVVDVRYVNSPGLIAWLVAMRVLRMTPGDGPLLRLWDGAVIPVARRIESWRRPPFGQSVFGVARVPTRG